MQLPSLWNGLVRSLRHRQKPQRQVPRSFDIEVTDIKPPTELETRSCARYNTIRNGHMRAVFDPHSKENKISRDALQHLMQATTFQIYPCQSVCLEWQCVPGHQPYRTTHRIVDTAEVNTISFYHNRQVDFLQALSRSELKVPTPAHNISISTSHTRSKPTHNRVPTWPINKMGKFSLKRHSRPNQTRLVAIPLGECDWLESERWELVPQKTVDPEHTGRLLQAPCSILSRDQLEPNLSSGSGIVSLNIGTSRQESQRNYKIRKAPTPKLEKYQGYRQEIAEVLPNVASSGEIGKPRSSSSTGRAGVESRALEAQGGLLCRPEQSRERESENGGPSIFAAKQPEHARNFILSQNDSVNTAIVKSGPVRFPDNELFEGGLSDPKSANKATKDPDSIPMGNEKSLNFDTVEGEVVGDSAISTRESERETSKSGEEHPLAISATSLGSFSDNGSNRWEGSYNQTWELPSDVGNNANPSDVVSTQPTGITVPSLANNDNEHHVRGPFMNTGLVASDNRSLEEIYGVPEGCDLEIEDLPFADDYWAWDEAAQNYYHDTTDIQGHQVKIWYPSSFD